MILRNSSTDGLTLTTSGPMLLSMQSFALKSQAASDFFDAAAPVLGDLRVRWEYERGYEKIADYILPFRSIAAKHGVTLGRMTARPFGFTFSVDGKTFQINISRNTVGYRRIA